MRRQSMTEASDPLENDREIRYGCVYEIDCEDDFLLLVRAMLNTIRLRGIQKATIRTSITPEGEFDRRGTNEFPADVRLERITKGPKIDFLRDSEEAKR